MSVKPFSDEQSRTIVNLGMAYEGWMDTLRRLNDLPYNLKIKQVSGREYLYEVTDRLGNAKSKGLLDDEKRAEFESYKDEKSELKDRLSDGHTRMLEAANYYRALRLPMLPAEVGRILQEADRVGYLGTQAMVVGTNALIAYFIEGNSHIVDAPLDTLDFDMALTAELADNDRPTLWKILKEVDSTFTVNTERPFQARNSKAFEVEILAAPSRIGGQIGRDKPRPVPIPEQEWLLNGRMVNQIVGVRGPRVAEAARIIAPDPRWYALQKLWMSEKPERNPLKRPKDLRQGLALMDAIWLTMFHYRLDDDFYSELPDELKPHFERWEKQKPSRD